MKKVFTLLLLVFSIACSIPSAEARYLEVSQAQIISQSREFDSNLWIYIVQNVLKANQEIKPERVISFLNKNQFSLFSELEQEVAFSLVLDKPALLMDFMTLKNERGDPYVPHLVALTRFIVDPNKAKEHNVNAIDTQVKTQLGLLQKFIDATPYEFRDAFYFKKYFVDISKVVDYTNFKHPREAAFAYHLGRQDGKIDWDKDSKKPKALIIAGEDDPNEAFAPTTAYVKFIQEIQEHYNVRYRVVGSPEAFCQAIDEAANEGNIELLIVGGHGSPQTIRLGRDSRLLVDQKLPDEDILKKLAPRATIFLESCATGNGKENAMNMANYFANHAPGRTVIAPIVPLTIYNEKLSFTPKFGVSLIDDEGRDISYRIEPDKKNKLCPSDALILCKN